MILILIIEKWIQSSLLKNDFNPHFWKKCYSKRIIIKNLIINFYFSVSTHDLVWERNVISRVMWERAIIYGSISVGATQRPLVADNSNQKKWNLIQIPDFSTTKKQVHLSTFLDWRSIRFLVLFDRILLVSYCTLALSSIATL